MNVIKPGNIHDKRPIYSGACLGCNAVIECFEEECTFVSDAINTHFIKCPTSNCDKHIPLKKGKWGEWVEPVFQRKEFYITPIVPGTDK